MKYIKSISHQGTSILYSNLSNLDPEIAKSAIQSTVNVISKMPLKSVCSLINLEGLELTRDLIAEIRSVGATNTPYVKATAICGLNPMARFIAYSVIKITKRNAKLFTNPEEGKTWLYEQDLQSGMDELLMSRKTA